MEALHTFAPSHVRTFTLAKGHKTLKYAGSETRPTTHCPQGNLKQVVC
jgi:hypothetical protein